MAYYLVVTLSIVAIPFIFFIPQAEETI